MSYPTPPAARMAYDRDGTQVLFVDAGGSQVQELTGAQVDSLNSEADISIESPFAVDSFVAFLFPEARDLRGFFHTATVDVQNAHRYDVEVSADTTNGVDGTWSTVISTAFAPLNNKPSYRSNIFPLTNDGMSGLRLKRRVGTTSTGVTYRRMRTIHLYGHPSDGQSLDRVRLWHPTLDEPLSSFDWGNAMQGSIDTREFRIKNDSATLTATDINLTLGAPTDASPSLLTQYDLSLDGSNFATSQVIASLTPGAISSPVTLRRQLDPEAALSLWTARLVVSPTTWS